MSVPDDSTEVLKALRLGWYLAEVRGRNWPAGPQVSSYGLSGKALPLHFERTAAELRIEAEAVLQQLATDLGVDGVDKITAATSEGSLTAAAWESVRELIFEFDAHAQDVLASSSDMQHAAYQLGRGLAETYWALDPEAPIAAHPPQQPDSWLFLLGPQRCNELNRLTGRLSAYFDPYCCPAIAGTIRLWQWVASDEQWRRTAQPILFKQLRRWYELLILGQDPSTLISPYALLKRWHYPLQELKVLRVQIVTAIISLILVITAIAFIAGDSHNPLAQSLLGILGLIGLSATSIQARLKSTTLNLTTRIRQSTYIDLVAMEIAEVPVVADPWQPQTFSPNRRANRKLAARRRKSAVRAVRTRTVTVVWDAPLGG